MLTPDIKKRLAAEQHDEKLVELLDKCKKLTKGSRCDMARDRRYEKWKDNLEVYRGYKPRTKADVEAAKFDEPESFITQLTFAQVQTFCAFAFLLLKQNANFFEFQPTGNEDYDYREISERIIQRDLNHNMWDVRLYQTLLDMTRQNFCATNCYWTTEKQWVQVQQQTVSMPGLIVPGTMLREEHIRYEGNAIYNISPCHFLPDTRLPLTRWREGQFCGDEDEWHIQELKAWEREDFAAGVQYVSSMSKRTWEDRGPSPFSKLETSFDAKRDETDFMVVVTQLQIELVPSEYNLGPEEYPLLYVIRYANDQRIISIEEAGYLHGEFTYDMAQYSPDNSRLLGECLSDVTFAIQDVVTWLINSRVESVRRSLEDRFVYDPSLIEQGDIDSRSLGIRVKKGAPKSTGVDKFIQQLKVVDTTGSHFQDAESLMKVMNLVTGVNENAMGQYSGGRRSATEARATNAGAASRMKMLVTLAWQQHYGPMGRKLLSNSRQGISFETFRKIVGEGHPRLQELYEKYAPNDPRLLVGSEDFFVFDGTLASEKNFMAQSLQELVVAMMSSPEVAMASGFDFQKAIEEIQLMRGITNVTRFFRPVNPGAAPNGVPGMGQQPPAPGAGRNGSVRSNGSVSPVAALPGGRDL